ncbi:hypothetical protein OG539_14885 [Actinacidiphila glaucinigra]|uniref:hypothetical protein n=1 Tax=Actinacidiphila glaucinigra TaxID=235986 RepID=UPI002DD93438|nr:hypothetical protein [Actinacidiphila glaucinigra]WSD62423.1 hypothetical protein OIE69_27825 [Actinacidiphila glaucinigra]
MTHPPRRVATAAAVLVTAAAVLLTGCSSGSDGKDTAAGDTPAPTAATSAPVPDEPATPTDPASDAVPSGPKVPKDELTPVTGSFTKKEKDYLSGRVPKGTDPAAVLQLGQETCDRIARVAEVDKDAAIGGIITGQIGGAKGAVTHLCPDQEDVLAAAGTGFADGSYTVGAKAKAGSVVVPGTYRALTPTKDCTWTAGTKTGTAHKVTITAGTKTFDSRGCFAWAREGR